MTAGKAASPVWLSTDWLLGQFGSQRKRAQNAYVRFVEEGQGLPSLWTNLKQQIYLGSDEFIRVPAEQASRRERLLRGSESPAPPHPQPAVV
jgi:putative transposase